MREEFEALNLPDFDARGRVTTEYIQAMKVAWTDPNPTFEGEFVRFKGIDVKPQPTSTPHPPVWIGGESKAAMRRVIAVGDGWYPFGSNPKFRMDTPEKYTSRRDMLFTLADEAERATDSITLSYNAAFHHHTEQLAPDGGGRLSFTGTPEQRAGDIQSFNNCGIQNFMVNVVSFDRNEMLERMEEFAINVMPLLRP